MRCFGDGDPLYEAYHDDEWGRPVTDARHMLERLCLEGFQAGLAWITILRKRDEFRRAFEDFDAAKVAKFGDRKKAALMENAGIVRNRLKIEATIANAQAALLLEAEGVDLAELVWSYAPEKEPKARKKLGDTPAETPESKALSKDLKKRGFRFVGPTTVYAAMQACGVVNDHIAGCPCREPVEAERARALRRWVSDPTPG